MYLNFSLRSSLFTIFNYTFFTGLFMKLIVLALTAIFVMIPIVGKASPTFSNRLTVIPSIEPEGFLSWATGMSTDNTWVLRPIPAGPYLPRCVEGSRVDNITGASTPQLLRTSTGFLLAVPNNESRTYAQIRNNNNLNFSFTVSNPTNGSLASTSVVCSWVPQSSTLSASSGSWPMTTIFLVSNAKQVSAHLELPSTLNLGSITKGTTSSIPLPIRVICNACPQNTPTRGQLTWVITQGIGNPSASQPIVTISGSEVSAGPSEISFGAMTTDLTNYGLNWHHDRPVIAVPGSYSWTMTMTLTIP